jgi:hypothetical protein
LARGSVCMIALLLVISIGCLRGINVGLLGVAMAYLLGSCYGMTARQIVVHWPTQLFVLLL